MQRWIQTRRALCSAPALPYLRCRGEQKGGSEKPILRQRRHQRPAQEQEGQAARSGCALTTLSPECCQGGFGTYRTTPAGLGVDQGRVPSARPVAQQRLQDCTGPHRVHREVLNPIAGRFWNRLACAVASRANSGHRCEAVHYERHRPEQTTLYRMTLQHAATFFARAEDAAGADVPLVNHEFTALLQCGTPRLPARALRRLRPRQAGRL